MKKRILSAVLLSMTLLLSLASCRETANKAEEAAAKTGDAIEKAAEDVEEAAEKAAGEVKEAGEKAAELGKKVAVEAKAFADEVAKKVAPKPLDCPKCQTKIYETDAFCWKCGDKRG